jgi:hypothetical protein
MALPVPPAGVPPEAAPAAPVPPAVAPRASNYREWYSDESNGPAPGRTADYLFGYRFDGGGIPAPAALRDQSVTLSDRQPLPFLCLIPGPGNTREVTVVHRLMRFMDLPGEEASGYHDRVLGLVGDILPHQYPVVEVPSTCFRLVGNAVRVPTTAAMNVLLPTWEDPSVPLGPYLEDAGETEVVRPRHIQLVPGYLAALLVHRRGVTAKIAYQELYGAIQAREEVAACQDVLTWLKAACTARGGDGAQNGIPIVLHPLTPLHLPASAYQYMTAKVRSDLPALAGGGAMTDDVTGTLVGALRAMTETRAGRGGDPADRPAKTINEAYKETFGTLLRYCNECGRD